MNPAHFPHPVALVTGATSGIGLETARALAAHGYSLIITARTEEKAQRACAEIRNTCPDALIHAVCGDLSSMRVVRSLAAEVLSHVRSIEALVNNAGVYLKRRTITPDGCETTFAVNHLAPFLLTLELMPALRAAASARIVTVSSMAHWFGRIDLKDPHGSRHYSPFAAYAQSKLANILFTRELARRLAGTSVTANCLHPGVIPTGLAHGSLNLFSVLYALGRPVLIGPANGARTTVHLVTSPDLAGVSGEYFAWRRIGPSSPRSRDVHMQEALWNLSEQLVDARWMLPEPAVQVLSPRV